MTAAAGFNPVAAAEALRKAMKGLGTDEGTIVKVLGHCTLAQRLQIQSAYKSKFDRDLIADLKSEISGDFLRLVLALFETPEQLTLTHLTSWIQDRHAAAVLDVLVVSSPEELAGLKAAYEKNGTPLADAVAGVFSGPLQSVLAAWCTGSRDASAADDAEAASVAQKIAENEAQMFADDSVLLTTLTVVSSAQLAAVSQAFTKLKGYSLADAAEKAGFAGEAATLRVLLAAAGNQSTAVADAVQRSVKGIGTDDSRLIWLVASRCEKDLRSASENYQQRYGTSLLKAVQDDTSGDYKALLCALIEG